MSQLSVVIPAFNEAGNIGRLVAETYAAVPGDLLGEVVVVDDCSTDGTAAEVAALMERHDSLRLIRHLTNAGQSASVRSGVLAARFPLIGTLDGDGQNDPADLPKLAALHRPEGPQLVGGIRAKRRDTLSKRLASRAANAIRRTVLHDDCPDTGCGTKVFSREVYLRLPFFHGQHRYLPALFRAYGCTTAYAPVNDRARAHGQSNYSNWRRGVMGAYDLVGVSWLIRRTRWARSTEEAKP
ncbi:glycosyl transferase [Maritimibacter sp. 55A14]|uniref:glycosyltransferase family 2 protein n=1 Tax=Maritimibacter sp. 55A14 TaxID=2174844 RepID=UPI000D613921|nr:glycosyltransferase family 2 protein [Maritimibacter sp. 55A14]PWE32102.1 glycosyl transferase [Maritimibacter sp. 55A14]